MKFPETVGKQARKGNPGRPNEKKPQPGAYATTVARTLFNTTGLVRDLRSISVRDICRSSASMAVVSCTARLLIHTWTQRVLTLPNPSAHDVREVPLMELSDPGTRLLELPGSDSSGCANNAGSAAQGMLVKYLGKSGASRCLALAERSGACRVLPQGRIDVSPEPRDLDHTCSVPKKCIRRARIESSTYSTTSRRSRLTIIAGW